MVPKCGTFFWHPKNLSIRNMVTLHTWKTVWFPCDWMWQYVGTWWKHSGIGFVVNSQSLTLYRFQSSSTQTSGDLLGEYLREKPKIDQIYTCTLGVVVIQIFFPPTWGKSSNLTHIFQHGSIFKQFYWLVDRFVLSLFRVPLCDHFASSHGSFVTSQLARQKTSS